MPLILCLDLWNSRDGEQNLDESGKLLITSKLKKYYEIVYGNTERNLVKD